MALIDDQIHVMKPPKSERKPGRVFVLGLRRAGKTSIQKVVFGEKQPHETLYIESTQDTTSCTLRNPLVNFEIWDFPGNYDLNDMELKKREIFSTCKVVVCVVDAQMRQYPEQLKYCEDVILLSAKHNKNIRFHVFIHKVESEVFDEDDAKFALFREIRDGLTKSIRQKSKVPISIDCHMTSIYDQSIFEAFSKVSQCLMLPQISTFLETMLNHLVESCDMEKAYIFDISSKIYLATDATPTNSPTFGLCSDVIEMVIDITSIYGTQESEFDPDNSSLITLSNGYVLITRQLARDLALVCYLRADISHTGVIQYNFEVFKDHMSRLLKLI